MPHHTPAVPAPSAQPGPADTGLIGFLRLERLERDLFRAWCHEGAPQRAFGGQVAAQALTAAGYTVDEPFVVHSLHGYFLRQGDTRRPIVYQVERLRDGRSYVSRRVTAVQAGEAIFTLSSSFKRPEQDDGVAPRQTAMPSVEPPEQLRDVFPPPSDSAEGDAFSRALTVRFPAPTGTTPSGGTEQWLWVKSAEPLPDSPMLHACALTYASDLLLAPSTALHLEQSWIRRDSQPGNLFLTSLDHAVWYHRPFRADDWMLVVQRSPTAGDGRGLAYGDFWSRDGRLIASVVQETVLRAARSCRS